jgi:hypothetical protein
MKLVRTLGMVLLALLFWGGAGFSQTFTAGKWSRTRNTPPTGVGHAMLLTDGSVLMINSGCNPTGNWYRLVPDNNGSYANGTWLNAGNLPAGYNPLYFASQVLPSGAVVVMGGEYLACRSAFSNQGAVYRPWTNKWSVVDPPPGWASIGDAQSIILPNGKMMLANCCTTDEAILTLTTSASWEPTGTGKADVNDEEGWTLLPSGKILTVNTYVGGGCCARGYQLYTPSTGAWTTPSATTVVNLVDPKSAELGPAALLPNGTVFAAGATTNNAIYTLATGKWTAAPKFGGTLDVADGPSAVLPDGNLLLDASPGVFGTGSKFFEWDGGTLHTVPGPPNASIDSSFVGHLVVLPTGQILFTDFSSAVELYTPGVATPCTGCAPTITSVDSTLTHGATNNVIKGTQFNGVTQGAYYGDDDQSFSNFPLVRITDSAGHVVYCNTHGWAGGVATGARIVSTKFDIPATIALGAATLEVVTNGIPSAPEAVTIE